MVVVVAVADVPILAGVVVHAPNFGNMANHSPSFNRPAGGGSSRPNFWRWQFRWRVIVRISAGETLTAEIDLTSVEETSSGGNHPNIGGGNLNIGNRPNIGGGIGNNTNIANRTNFGDRTNIGNRTNIGHIGDNNFNNFRNNNFNHLNIASNRPYYNNWQQPELNLEWNRPGGGGVEMAIPRGYSRGYWNGGWGGYWHGGMGGGAVRHGTRPIAWELGSWATGSVARDSGYADYTNPYYVVTAG